MSPGINVTDYNNTSPKDYSKYVRYYKNLETYYLTWYLPITILVGLIGGIVCIIFLILSKLFPKNVLIWMICICIGDLMILSFDASRMLLKVYFKYDIRDINDLFCQIHNFLSNYFFYWSSYMQACMSVQRLIFMMRPLKARSLFTDRLVLKLFGVISVLLVGPMLPYLIYWRISPKNKDCEPSEVRLYLVTTVLDIVVWGFVPLVTMTGSTVGISWALFRAKSERQNLGNHRKTLGSGKGRSKGSAQTDNAWHVTRLLIGMNTLYLVSAYPLLIYQIYLNSDGNKVGRVIPQPLHKTIYYFLRSLCYLGCSWNWIFYVMGGRKFREKAVQLIRNCISAENTQRVTEAQTKLITLSF